MKFTAFLIFGFICFCCISVLDWFLSSIRVKLQKRKEQKELSIDVCEVMDEK